MIRPVSIIGTDRQTATKRTALFYLFSNLAIYSRGIFRHNPIVTMHFTKPLLATIIPSLAASTNLNPLKSRTIISPPFHLLAIHPTSPLHLQPINARLGGFSIGQAPETHCPQAPCPIVDQTGFIVANGKAFLVRPHFRPSSMHICKLKPTNHRMSRSQEVKTSTLVPTARSPSLAPAARTPFRRAV